MLWSCHDRFNTCIKTFWQGFASSIYIYILHYIRFFGRIFRSNNQWRQRCLISTYRLAGGWCGISFFWEVPRGFMDLHIAERMWNCGGISAWHLKNASSKYIYSWFSVVYFFPNPIRCPTIHFGPNRFSWFPDSLSHAQAEDPDASGGAPSAAAALPGGAASEDIATTDTIPVAGCNSSWWAEVKKNVCVYV